MIMKKYNIMFLLMLLAAPAFAQTTGATLGTIADEILNTVPGILQVMEAGAYIAGIVLGIKGIFKLKEANESKGQVKLSVPIIMIIAAVILLALPTAITVGVQGFGLNQAAQQPFMY